MTPTTTKDQNGNRRTAAADALLVGLTLTDDQLQRLATIVATEIIEHLPTAGERRTGLNTAEAATYVGCSVETLRDEVAARKIASYQAKPRAPHRFDIADLDAYRTKYRLEALN